MKITNDAGAITHPVVLASYERICGRSGGIGCGHPERVRSAEAFLRLCERYAAKGQLHRIIGG